MSKDKQKREPKKPKKSAKSKPIAGATTPRPIVTPIKPSGA